MRDLFDSSMLERLPVPDAEILLLRKMDLGEDPDNLLRQLIAETPWRAEHITLWGQSHLQPRLTAWYSDPGLQYTYSGITLRPQPWPAALLSIKTRVESLAEVAFNSVLLNYYRDHRDSMGMHSDNEPELGPQPVIASVSFGAERSLILRHRYRKELKPISINLPSGSLLLMRGETQTYWKHGINKEREPCGPRINLTFRRLLASTGA